MIDDWAPPSIVDNRQSAFTECSAIQKSSIGNQSPIRINESAVSSYSLSAAVGFKRTARSAGMKLAVAAMASISAATNANVHGSTVLTP